MHRELYVSEKLTLGGAEGSNYITFSETYNLSAINCLHHDSRDKQMNRRTIGVTIIQKSQNIEFS